MLKIKGLKRSEENATAIGADIVSWAIAPGKRLLVVLLGLHAEPICLIRVTGSQRRLLPRL